MTDGTDEVSVHVAASPERVWALVSDVTQMGRWSPECTGGRWRDGADGPAVGVHFTGSNRRGPVRWSTRCTVVDAEAPAHFSFTVRDSGMRWGYRLAPEDGGTRLTEYRLHVGRTPLLARLFAASGVGGRDREGQMRRGMEQTLARVKAAAEA